VIGDILQPTHLLLILVVALLVLGPKRLPEVSRSLGRGLREFRGAISGEHDDHDSRDYTAAIAETPVAEPAVTQTPAPAPTPPEPTVAAAPVAAAPTAPAPEPQPTAGATTQS
jgi:TatA/E family protein of Tat protein translocase